MDLVKRLEEYRDRERALAWEGTFAQYFEIACKRPKVARLSHERIYDMIMEAGVETTRNGELRYNFFSQEIFGIEKALQQIVDYFHSAAQRLEVRKRILLLMGPVGGGKSTIVQLLKRGLEAYTRTEAGAVYAIKGCPMHEEPLHLIPQELRPDIEKEFGLYIEGDLCPRCRYMLDNEYHGRIEDVPVQRIAFSEKYRIGIGTFTPSDPKSQDISELVGGIDLSTIGEVGVESDPRAYRFDGELNVANRGLMEFIEMLKVDEKFLYVLLTLSQEQNIKTGRFSMIYADEVVVSHTNEHEYQAFVGNKKSEALQDRIILVRVPYNLRVSDEIKIYEKLLKQSALHNVHIAPYTLRIASIFAVLTRLEPSKKAGMSLMKKLRLYDGEDIEDFKQKDVRELQEEAQREGMDGISPRYVINRLSNALVRQNVTCINPIDALRALRDGLDQHTSITREERERYLNFISEARKEYDELAKKEVQRAFVYSYEEAARTLLNNYLDNVEAYCNKTKLRDPITDEEIDPDEQLMRSIEEQIGITENAKRAFREEILIRISSLARKGLTFDYTSHERLKEAIEKKLFADLRDVVKITTSTRTPDKEQRRKINEVVERLVTEHGYCYVCANEILRYVGSLLNR
ncbi:MAG: PrkA family serine protein kinase [Thermogemmatispora sp.]|jgi:serine protein kinase|uniref:Protein prkA n=2 Tax=Thermogemmatispora TaxID=768669 RepID=A0A328VP40_9CHLR|nr:MULTISPECIES: PrkA family serine protein kinase [Thermogemmatispora]MBE3566798.1 PrkA family serine protein kinase [Thermogemmatispora sp.]MBX5455988.1 PrkA family serine protein kinase [Thermogemmatispora sp.]RAQ97952.1 protein prkA [Thermogemmatispora tikiterensis]GER83326.1 protein PrkA [Thermogemmatispora aurantia]